MLPWLHRDILLALVPKTVIEQVKDDHKFMEAAKGIRKEKGSAAEFIISRLSQAASGEVRIKPPGVGPDTTLLITVRAPLLLCHP